MHVLNPSPIQPSSSIEPINLTPWVLFHCLFLKVSTTHFALITLFPDVCWQHNTSESTPPPWCITQHHCCATNVEVLSVTDAMTMQQFRMFPLVSSFFLELCVLLFLDFFKFLTSYYLVCFLESMKCMLHFSYMYLHFRYLQSPQTKAYRDFTFSDCTTAVTVPHSNTRFRVAGCLTNSITSNMLLAFWIVHVQCPY